MNASKGTEEYHVGEIFLSATPDDAGADARTMPTRSSSSCSNGASFAGYARQYSEASTAAVGGDLGWVRPEQLPDAARRRAPPDAAGHDQQPDPGSGRRFDHRRAGHAQDPDRRPARRGAQPEADFGQLPQGHDARSRPSRSSPRFADAARRRSAAAAAPTRSPPTSTARSSAATRSRCATCRRRCSR